MSEPDEPEVAGVLSSLPTTRPQRRSPKRDPARAGARSGSTAAAKSRTRASAPDPAATAPAAASAEATPGGEGRRQRAPIAAQGFEPDTVHGAVEPPSRADLLGSVLQGTGELVHLGVALGRHLLRSALGRRPGC